MYLSLVWFSKHKYVSFKKKELECLRNLTLLKIVPQKKSISTHSKQCISIVTSTMNECNMGFFFVEMKVLICYSVNKWIKNIGVKNTFAKIIVIFSKFPYQNCANCKFRKTSKQLLVIFHNKFPYKKCILCFNLKLMCCPIITYPPRHFIYMLPITTTGKRIRNGVDVVVHLVASREKTSRTLTSIFSIVTSER